MKYLKSLLGLSGKLPSCLRLFEVGRDDLFALGKRLQSRLLDDFLHSWVASSSSLLLPLPCPIFLTRGLCAGLRTCGTKLCVPRIRVLPASHVFRLSSQLRVSRCETLVSHWNVCIPYDSCSCPFSFLLLYGGVTYLLFT